MGRILGNLGLALATLTRLPVPGLAELVVDDDRQRAAAVWYPLVGFGLGLGWWGLACGGLALGLAPGLVAIGVLVITYLLNGFLHFDGFCDCCDALLVYREQEERLRILKDSRIGSFALGGGALLLLTRWQVLATIMGVAAVEGNDPRLLALLVPIPLVARYGILITAWRAQYPRERGTAGFLVGRLSEMQLAAATVLLLACLGLWLLGDAEHATLLAVGFPNLPLAARFESLMRLALILMVGLVSAIGLRLYATRKLGGVTGDVLGATVEVGETVMLVALYAALLSV